MIAEKEPPMIPDSEYVRQFQAGDVEAFVPLYERYLPRIGTYIRKKVWNAQDREDLSAQIFTLVFKHLPRFDNSKLLFQGTDNFKAWIFQIAHNEIVSHYRKRAKHGEILVPDVWRPEEAIDIEEKIDHPESMEELLEPTPLKLIEKLIVLRRVDEDVDYSDIAQELGISVAATRIRFFRSKEKLKKEFGKEDNSNGGNG